jgi:uncharacterized protein (TIGR04255 family)
VVSEAAELGNRATNRHVERASSRNLTSHPGFMSPPIVELVLSVGFQPLPLNVSQIGDLARIFGDRFPAIEQKPSYAMPIEVFGPASQLPTVSLQLFDGISLPRVWLIDARGTDLVQIQSDWFARNWRRVTAAESYPRYPVVSDAFADDLERFRSYLEAEGMLLQPTQCEITYIDHIDLPRDGGLASVVAKLEEDREFDLRPEAQAISTDYPLEINGEAIGRLHVTANTAERRDDGRSIAVLNFTARGIPLGDGIPGVIAFQDLGREWAWKAFTRLVREDLQQAWKTEA